MRLLLDESVPRRLRRALSAHTVKTAVEMGWSGVKNGALMALAAAEFDAFITVDRNLPHQQNVATVPIAVVVLIAPSNELHLLLPLVPRLEEALAALTSIPPAVRRRKRVPSCSIAFSRRSWSQGLNNRWYSNGRTALALIVEAPGCRGLISETHSSGTIAEGTIRMGDRRDASQSEPMFTLARPAGIAAQVGGNAAVPISSRRAHTAAGTSIATRNRFKGSPESPMCAAVSNTAMAIVGAQ